MFSLNEKEPIFVRPELLLHPGIPLPLSGLNPRTILGKRWWAEQKKKVKKKNNNCCWACGEFPAFNTENESPVLEAHESYRYIYIDTGPYENRVYHAELEEVVGLCWLCHNFIHKGRLLRTKKLSVYFKVCERGYLILKKNDLLSRYRHEEAMLSNIGHIPWNNYALIVNGKKYSPLFENEDALLRHYNTIED